jgi:hypothetical protein
LRTDRSATGGRERRKREHDKRAFHCVSPQKDLGHLQRGMKRAEERASSEVDTTGIGRTFGRIQQIGRCG